MAAWDNRRQPKRPQRRYEKTVTGGFMQNIGEEIAGEYLRVKKGCDFIQYNIHTEETQGEIDVIGINLNTKPHTVYICEVATHTNNLQYVKNRRPDTENRLRTKFKKDIAYANKHFEGYDKVFMFWSPIIRTSGPDAKYCAQRAVDKFKSELEKIAQIEIISNQKYLDCIKELKEYAANKSSDLSNSAVLRFLQIEAFLENHVAKLEKQKNRENKK